MRGRGEAGKANSITLGLGAGNWEGPASCWLLLMWILWPPRRGLAGHGGGCHNRASFIPPPLSWDCRDNREHRDGVQGGAWCPVVPWQRLSLSARALQSCSVRGHGKYCRVQFLQGCWCSASGFFQLS